ncbi:MAG: radical SAM protein, partial [Desulfovibrio sp.]|nr:radical SAM protein [Desulfovibrio sp.]
SSVTDPYQPLERRFGRTRALLEEMQGSGCTLSIATKSDLVLRDLELIKTFPRARVSFSINTLDEGFRRDMDKAASIGRRLEAMQAFHEAGVRTTCFISPIFPGITDPCAIILRARAHCNLVWLENLNLRGGFRKDILDYIHAAHPELDGLYSQIYLKGDRSWWHGLDQKMRAFTKEQGLGYVRSDDSMDRPFDAPPVVVNYFFHEEIVPSAKKKNR